MSSLQRRARAVLAARMRSLLAAEAVHRDAEHTVHFADALAPTLTADDAAWAHAQLAVRAKGELRPTRAGAVPAHAAWSSTTLVCSAFTPWRRHLAGLRLAGLEGFTEIQLEERLHIPHGGGTPNLDVALRAPGTCLGVESKLTEHPRRAQTARGAPPTAARRWPPRSAAAGPRSSPRCSKAAGGRGSSTQASSCGMRCRCSDHPTAASHT